MCIHKTGLELKLQSIHDAVFVRRQMYILPVVKRNKIGIFSRTFMLRGKRHADIFCFVENMQRLVIYKFNADGFAVRHNIAVRRFTHAVAEVIVLPEPRGRLCRINVRSRRISAVNRIFKQIRYKHRVFFYGFCITVINFFPGEQNLTCVGVFGNDILVGVKSFHNGILHI